MKRILELNHNEAKEFFLKEESYFNFDLPKYYVFSDIIQEMSTLLEGHKLSNYYGSYLNEESRLKPTKPDKYENVNYTFLKNKDGKYGWRPFQLIHPAIYVSLVNEITEEVNWQLLLTRFDEFAANPNIQCCSIPVKSEGVQSDKATNVSQWWHNIELQSIELSLQYEYVLHTDISDCYGSIYTHSIPWAIHTKPVAKENRDSNGNLGNIIDKHLRNMSFGQTNGIPQGSVLMDFIAEMVLGYADVELSNKIQLAGIHSYHILRYRDDYRIFSSNPQFVELIAKILTEVLVDLGMRLNAQKTFVSNSVIKDSIKPDKLYWISQKNSTNSIREHLLLIHGLSEKYPNSGSLTKSLGKFYSRIQGLSELNNIEVLISIVVDVMYKNPRSYPITTAILSKLLSLMDSPAKKDKIITTILTKFDQIPNTGHLQLWLQRLTIKTNRNKVYTESLCEIVYNPTQSIWNSDWLNESIKTRIESISIIDELKIQNIDEVISQEEVELFKPDYLESIEE